MLSYQHIYHAGNFADVQKHAVLTELMNFLKKKGQYLLSVDTHAGRGIYNLSSKEALKIKEFKYGINHFYNNSVEKTPITDYIKLVSNLNNKKTIKLYPGSAKIIERLSSNKDIIVLAEKHPKEILFLKENFKERKNIIILNEDGFETLNNYIPSNTHKTFAIIDPSYEIKDEYITTIDKISN